ncbi:MAG: hypothetical protein JXR95_10570 [Deltaproteobacteria bacterium]|nr:hypothetical protein [Deltaproteobacteria bacterium]
MRSKINKLNFLTGRHDLLSDNLEFVGLRKEYETGWFRHLALPGVSGIFYNWENAFTWPIQLRGTILTEDRFPTYIQDENRQHLKEILDLMWKYLGQEHFSRLPVTLETSYLESKVITQRGNSMDAAVAVLAVSYFSSTTVPSRIFITGIIDSETGKIEKVGNMLEKIQSVYTIVKTEPQLRRMKASVRKPLFIYPLENTEEIPDLMREHLAVVQVSSVDELIKTVFGFKPELSDYFNYNFSHIVELEKNIYFSKKTMSSEGLELFIEKVNRRLNVMKFRLYEASGFKAVKNGYTKKGLELYGKCRSILSLDKIEMDGISRIVFLSRELAAYFDLFPDRHEIETRIRELEEYIDEIMDPVELLHLSGTISRGYEWMGDYEKAFKVKLNNVELIETKISILSPELGINLSRSYSALGLLNARRKLSSDTCFKKSSEYLEKSKGIDNYTNQKLWNRFNEFFSLYLNEEWEQIFDLRDEIQNFLGDDRDYRRFRSLSFLAEASYFTQRYETSENLQDKVSDICQSLPSIFKLVPLFSALSIACSSFQVELIGDILNQVNYIFPEFYNYYRFEKIHHTENPEKQWKDIRITLPY